MEARAFGGLRLDWPERPGRNLLTWPLGRFTGTGDGEFASRRRRSCRIGRCLPRSPRAGRAAAGVHVAAPRVANQGLYDHPASPPTFPLVFSAPIGGAIRYTYDPEWVTFAPGWIATPSTYVELQGRTAWGDHVGAGSVTSGDWQETTSGSRP